MTVLTQELLNTLINGITSCEARILILEDEIKVIETELANKISNVAKLRQRLTDLRETSEKLETIFIRQPSEKAMKEEKQ